VLPVDEVRDGLFGSSQPMLDLKSYLAKVARSDATVLVTGETGTGKERVASSLHKLGPRVDAPFISVNCAALPETLIESELFGHCRGAFTGATGDFLDEVGELSPASQAKLLRVIENREVVAVGSVQRRKINIRLVVATNVELEEMVAHRTFRADLFYRLNVVRIEMPPLRERLEDIGPILEHFIGQQNRRLDMRVGCPDRELLEQMRHYDWPGNVRELRNMVEAVFVDPPQDRPMCVSDLPPNFRRLFRESARAGQDEREQLVGVLRDTNWNKVAAAREMNWSRMTLYRKLAKYDLNPGGR
jgi:transcriptional regulator with PAS, ATPase and Fis domain